MWIERYVVSLVILGLLTAVVRPLIGVITALMVGTGMCVVMETAVGCWRIVRPACIAGSKLRLTRRCTLPIGRCRRRGVVRLPRAPVGLPEFGKRIALPEQTRKLGQRIANACLLARLCRLGGAAIGIIGTIGSQPVVVSGEAPVSELTHLVGGFDAEQP